MKQNNQEVFEYLKENSQSRLMQILNEEKWNITNLNTLW